MFLFAAILICVPIDEELSKVLLKLENIHRSHLKKTTIIMVRHDESEIFLPIEFWKNLTISGKKELTGKMLPCHKRFYFSVCFIQSNYTG